MQSEINRSAVSKGVRGAIKKGGMKGVLTAAGSVVPGFGNVAGFIAGTVIDAVYGDEINEMVDGAADMILEDSQYSFTCPGCGHQWVMEEDEIKKMINNGADGSDNNESVFNQFWDYFLENPTTICETRDSLMDFIASLDSNMPEWSHRHLNTEYSQMQFLKSWAILIFLLDNGNDEELETLGKTASSESHRGSRLDKGCKYMKAIFEMMTVNIKEPGAFGRCNSIIDETKTFLVKDSLLKPEAFKEYMDTFYYRKLSSLVDEIEKKKNFRQALKVYKKMIKIDYFNAKVEGYGRLCQYYRFYEDEGVKNDLNKAFDYAKKCVAQIDIDSVTEYSSDDWLANIWIDNLGFAALAYSITNGPEYKPYYAYKLAKKGYDLGDDYCTFLMGVFAEEGTGQTPNASNACTFYKEAIARGCNMAEEALKKLEGGNSEEKSALGDMTSEEQEYMDALKEYLSDGEISERERKMLRRVRKALGISEERAAELEDSLAKSKLTEEENEYYEAYSEYRLNGEIDEKIRKRLEIFRKGLGITAERAAEIENITS